MTSNRGTIEATGNTVRGPWDEQPLRPSLPVAVPATDPRLELSENALVLASQNAFPIVATRKTRRDNLGLAAGGAIALVLGCATFISLNASRHSATGTAVAPAAATQSQSGLPMAATVPGRPIAMPPSVPATNPQTGAMPGMAPMPGAAPMPGMGTQASPVLVYDGSSPSITAGPNSPRDADGAPTLLGGATPGRALVSDGS